MVFCNTPRRQEKAARVLARLRVYRDTGDSESILSIVVASSRMRRNALSNFKTDSTLYHAEEAAVALSISPTRSSIATLDSLTRQYSDMSHVFLESLRDIIQTAPNERLRRIALDVLLDFAISEDSTLSRYAKSNLNMLEDNDMRFVDGVRKTASRVARFYQLTWGPRTGIFIAGALHSLGFGFANDPSNILYPILSVTLAMFVYATHMEQKAVEEKHALLQSTLVNAAKTDVSAQL